jgi:hypothetical protein
MPITLALILAEELKDNNVNKKDNNIPKIIATRVKQA